MKDGRRDVKNEREGGRTEVRKETKMKKRKEGRHEVQKGKKINGNMENIYCRDR